jgi:hypothetical protein
MEKWVLFGEEKAKKWVVLKQFLIYRAKCLDFDVRKKIQTGKF